MYSFLEKQELYHARTTYRRHLDALYSPGVFETAKLVPFLPQMMQSLDEEENHENSEVDFVCDCEQMARYYYSVNCSSV
jgi:hypothetical protein